MALNRYSIPFAYMMSFLLGCSINSPDDDIATQGGGSTILQEGLDELHADGMTGVLAEVHDGDRRIVARSGVAELGSERPVDFDSYFRMGSNTKPFVAVVVLQLVDEGVLTLEDTVDQWLPGVVSGNGYDGKLITIRQLLQHTSGIFNYTDLMPWLDSEDGYLENRLKNATPEEMVALGLQHEQLFPPGGGWSYSNTNYMLGGMIIERATGNPWSAEVQSRILEPLGLEHTFEPGDDPEIPSPHATAYQQFTDGGPLSDVTVLNHTIADAAGSLITTTADLAKFWGALQQGSLLKPEQMAQMHDTVDSPEFQQVWPGMRYGLGVMYIPTSCGGGYWSHGGDTLGFATRNATSEDGSRVVVLSLSTQLEDALPSLADTNEMFDKLMCVGRIEE